MTRRVLVVGAGVIGLSCAVRLLEAGHQVDVLARDLPLETTSAVAAAIWYPYLAYPADRVAAWGAATLHELTALADVGVPGVVMRRGTELLRAETATPSWAGAVPDFARLQEVPEPFVGGFGLTVPVIEMGLYLPWLRCQIHRLGGTVTRLALSHLPRPPHRIVVNCSGLGSYGLAKDRSMRPVRGQIVLLEQFGLTEWSIDSGDAYVVPRSRDIVVGGTADVDDWNRAPDPATAERLIARAAELAPDGDDRLLAARVVAHRVGLRPARPSVRLEQEGGGPGRVVHCYGHGGSGVTLSWGCADQVADIVGAA